MGAVIDYTPAEFNMWRLIVVRNHLDVLYCLVERNIAHSPAVHYGTLRLVQFLDSYHGLMGALDERQKKLVLCATDLIPDVVGRRDGLRAVRNGWVAHLQDEGRFAEDASDFLRRVGLSDDPSAYYEMIASAIKFVDAVTSLLPDISRQVVEKFNRTGDAKLEFYCVDSVRIGRNVDAKLDAVRDRVEREFPGMQWGPPLGSAGASLGQLGPAGASDNAVCEGGRRKGDGDRQ